MDELILAIKAWPVIIQGALGSALFWLILLIGQRLTSTAINKYSHHSKATRKSFLISTKCKYQAFLSDDDSTSAFLLIALIYRALRFLFKALMWLSLGLIFQSLLEITGVIGFAGCLYYLFKAYELVKPYKEDTDIELELEKINSELSEISKT